MGHLWRREESHAREQRAPTARHVNKLLKSREHQAPRQSEQFVPRQRGCHMAVKHLNKHAVVLSSSFPSSRESAPSDPSFLSHLYFSILSRCPSHLSLWEVDWGWQTCVANLFYQTLDKIFMKIVLNGRICFIPCKANNELEISIIDQGCSHRISTMKLG